MSVWPYLLGREFAQSMAIGDLNARLRQTEVHRKHERRREADARDARDARLDEVEQEIGELALFVRTLYRLAVEKGSITPAEFAEAAKAIDRSDGREDGRYTPGHRPG